MRNTQKILALFLALTMLATCLPLSAAATEYVKTWMEASIDVGEQADYVYGTATGSSAFAAAVWRELFGYDIFSAYCEVQAARSDYDDLGSYLRREARAGDILVFSGRHAMLLHTVGRGGLTVYETPAENTGAPGESNAIARSTYTYDDIADLFEETSYYLCRMNDEVYDYVNSGYDGLTEPQLVVPAGENILGDTAAQLTLLVRTLPGRPLDTIGIEILTADNRTVSTGYAIGAENYSAGGFYYRAVFDTRTQGVTLSPGTDYRYRFTGAVGRANYYSDWSTFKTTGNPDKPKEYTLLLDANGGMVRPGTLTVAENTKIGELPTPTRQGYEFLGWYTATGVQVTAATVYAWTEGITLYARWSDDTITLYLDAAGGTVYPATLQVTRGRRIGELPVPTLKGATFAGWYTAEGNRVTARTVFDQGTRITLYARWSDRQIKVSFHANKGNVSQKSMMVEPEGYFGELPVPTRKDYRFVGWFTEKKGGYQVTQGSRVWFDEDCTLYAHWECTHKYRNGKCVQCGDYDQDYQHHKHNRGMHNFGHRRDYGKDRFKDVREDDWYYDTVSKAYALGLIDGMSLATFEPDGILTYAQAVKLAAGLHNIYYNGSTTFVTTNPWYWAYVDYAIDNGIMDEDFDDYNAAITRAEFVALIGAALPEEALEQINSVADDSLPDVDMGYAYAPFIYRLYRAGVLTGVDEYGTFKPNTSIKRSEVATIIARMADTSVRCSFKLK